MLKKDNIEAEKVAYNGKKVESARGKSYKLDPSDLFLFCLLIAAAAISIFIIENYQ